MDAPPMFPPDGCIVDTLASFSMLHRFLRVDRSSSSTLPFVATEGLASAPFIRPDPLPDRTPLASRCGLIDARQFGGLADHARDIRRRDRAFAEKCRFISGNEVPGAWMSRAWSPWARPWHTHGLCASRALRSLREHPSGRGEEPRATGHLDQLGEPAGLSVSYLYDGTGADASRHRSTRRGA